MAMAHTRPSLRTRIVQAQSRPTTIPAGESGIEPPATKSFTERYSDTEFATPADPIPTRHEPAVANGRLFVLVSGSAVTSVLAVSLLSVLG